MLRSSATAARLGRLGAARGWAPLRTGGVRSILTAGTAGAPRTLVVRCCGVGLGASLGVGAALVSSGYASAEAAPARQSLFGLSPAAAASSSDSEVPVVEVPVVELAVRPGLLQLALQNTQRAFKCVLRAAYLALVFGPLCFAVPLSWYDSTREYWWVWCVHCVELSGALCIKLAQWASSRPDLFGANVCERFRHLQDDTPPHAWRATAHSLDQMFGPAWRESLRLEQKPIGSGCIAQVYRGEMRVAAGTAGGVVDASTGEIWVPVAIKVLHPGVRETIHVDMDLLNTLGGMLHSLPKLKWLNPAGMLQEFAGMLLRQLDLGLEAKNLERFQANFPPEKSDVLFPRPLWPYISPDVLVESYIEGEPVVGWAARKHKDDPERQRISIAGSEAFIKMLFVDNFVHGDLHPGNIFVTPSGQLAFLDAGIAVTYSQADHEHLIDVLACFIQYDGWGGAKLMAEHSEEQDALRDIDGFCEKIQKMVEFARDHPSFFDQVSGCISLICNSACDHCVKLKSGFISIALSVKVVEGAVIQVDPMAKVAPLAKVVIVREHVKRKGRNLLGRSLSTGHLIENDDGEGEDQLIAQARSRATAGHNEATTGKGKVAQNPGV